MVRFRFYSKFVSLFILIGLFLALVLPIEAHFLEESTKAIQTKEAISRLPEVSLLPDSFFYFLKSFKEKIQSFFIFNIESKLAFQMDIANKRLAELVDLTHKNQEQYIEKALESEGRALFELVELMVQAEDGGVDIQNLEKIHKQLLDDHELILLNIEDDVPEDSKAAYSHILDVIDQNRDYMEREPQHEVEQVPTQPLEEKHGEEEHEPEEEERSH